MFNVRVQPRTHSRDRGLRPVSHTQLFDDVLHRVLHSPHAVVHLMRYLFVRQPVRQQSQYLQLTR